MMRRRKKTDQPNDNKTYRLPFLLLPPDTVDTPKKKKEQKKIVKKTVSHNNNNKTIIIIRNTVENFELYFQTRLSYESVADRNICD